MAEEEGMGPGAGFVFGADADGTESADGTFVLACSAADTLPGINLWGEEADFNGKGVAGLGWRWVGG